MALQRKLGKPTDQRMAIIRNQVTALLFDGKIVTTHMRAKEVSRVADKLLTLAINSYTDTVKKVETRKNSKGKEIKLELINDGPKKLTARRKIMAAVYDVAEPLLPEETYDSYKTRTEKIAHPLVEKIFNELAPRYAVRAQEKGTAGGYTRVLKMGVRRGDSTEMALIELV